MMDRFAKYALLAAVLLLLLPLAAPAVEGETTGAPAAIDLLAEGLDLYRDR